jgi:hypothetical protein
MTQKSVIIVNQIITYIMSNITEIETLTSSIGRTTNHHVSISSDGIYIVPNTGIVVSYQYI